MLVLPTSTRTSRVMVHVNNHRGLLRIRNNDLELHAAIPPSPVISTPPPFVVRFPP